MTRDPKAVAREIAGRNAWEQWDPENLAAEIERAILAAVEAEREADCAAIRAACGACGGSGSVAEPGHDCGGDPDRCARNCPIEVETQCEYCGRPIDAIRARGGRDGKG